MTEETFAQQMKRLKEVFGDRYYAPERLKVMWRAFQNVFDNTFVEAVDYCIANCRNAPLLEDLDKEIRVGRQRTFQRGEMKSAGDIMKDIRSLKTADPEFAKLAVRLVTEEKPKMSHEQWVDACKSMDEMAKGLEKQK